MSCAIYGRDAVETSGPLAVMNVRAQRSLGLPRRFGSWFQCADRQNMYNLLSHMGQKVASPRLPMLRLETLAELRDRHHDATKARVKEFAIGDRQFNFNSQPAIMGVINLSPG